MSECQIVVGLNWDEDERIEKLKRKGRRWKFITPLEHRWEGVPAAADEPIGKPQWIEYAADRGLPRSLAYIQGLPHDNCGGACVRAGIGHYVLLHKVRPSVFSQWKGAEIRTMAHTGSKWGMLKCRRGGVAKPLTLADLERRITGGDVTELEALELGGCACALPVSL